MQRSQADQSASTGQYELLEDSTPVQTRAELFHRILSALSVIQIQFPNGSDASPDTIPGAGVSGSSTEHCNCLEYHSSTLSGSLHAKMNEKRLQGEMIDLTLRCDGQNCEAHQLVVSSVSPYLSELIKHQELANTRHLTVDVPNIDPATCKELVDFMYTGDLRVLQSNVRNLIGAAEFLQMNEVLTVCVRFLKTNLHSSNWSSILRIAELLKVSELTQACVEFARDNLRSIDHVELIELSDASQFERVISGEGVSEDDRLKTIIHWVNKDTHGRERFASDLFQLVRVTNLSDEYFSSLVDSSESWSSSAWFLKFLADAVRSFHKRNEMDAECFDDRKELIFVAGGVFCNSTVETFDPQTQLRHCEDVGCSSQQRVIFHFPNLPEGRRECAAVSLGEYIYILGGVKSSGATNEVLILNTATRLWTNGPRMQTNRSCLGAAALHGKIYAAGGYDERNQVENTVEVLNPSPNHWQFIAPMSIHRCGLSLIAAQGRLYALGGFNCWDNWLDSVECYNPSTNCWTRVASMLSFRSSHGSCVFGDQIYVVGGFTLDDDETNGVEAYDINKNTWRKVASMNIRRHGVSVVALGGFIYAVGGRDEHWNDVYSVERYDPAPNNWTLLPARLKEPRWFAGATIIRSGKPES